MRSLVRASIVVAGLLWAAPATAQDVESLKKELEQMRRQFESMRDGYERAINQLGERIKALESKQPPAVAAPGTPPPATTSPPAPATPAPSPPSPPATVTPTPAPSAPPATAT